MLHCPGSGQELLSALGVTLVCHASNVFLILKVPLSLIDAFSKINDVVVGPDVISDSRTFGRSFDISQMFFFSGIKSSTSSSNITPRTICTGIFIHDIGLRFHRRSEFGNCCCRVVNGLFTTVTSSFLRIPIKGSVIPLI